MRRCARFFLRFFFLILSVGLCACDHAYAPKVPRPDDPSGVTNGMGRAEPGYVQWLERKSMLAKTGDLSRLVTASPLQWRLPSLPPAPQALFAHADTWLAVHPLTLSPGPKEGAFAHLSDSGFWEALQKNHIRGLYLAPAASGGAIWRAPAATLDLEEDEAELAFPEALGTDSDYQELVRQANRHGAITGLRLVTASSGLGPDFFLAARAFRDYAGLYAMIEVPQSCWALLPPVEREWEGSPVSGAALERLARETGFSPRLEQDRLGLPGGWAATQEVRGIDGAGRRFLYRWYGSPHEAVFNWYDPERSAQRIASAAVLRAIGQLGSALAGIRLAPFAGLAPASPQALSLEEALYPAREAAVALGAETRRYGGWSMGLDPLPFPWARLFLREGLDFMPDTVTSPAAEHALLTGNARLLRASLDAALRQGMDMMRLVHAAPHTGGVDYSCLRLLAAAPLPADDRRALSWETAREEIEAIPGAPSLLHAGSLSATAPALAALALGRQDMAGFSPETVEEIKKGHLALLFFKAFQPGLLLLSAYDLAGALPLSWAGREEEADALPAFGSVGLTAAAAPSPWGLPQAPVLYAPLAVQAHEPESVLNSLGPILARRAALRVAGGTLAARIKAVGSGVIVLATRLPDDGGTLISMVNFGRAASHEHLNLRRDLEAAGWIFPGGMASDVFGSGAVSVAGGFLGVSLAPWQYRAFHIPETLKRAAAQDIGKTAPDTP